ncbi:LRR domain containing protein [Parasponia andersonii]|uniref:LRR domain containing protein n=1 Tax=Parasponia andersonii TaxID=3476 RepID=A0A2P5CVD1_PARAD|nr:LRR domain containing protein [Parasponia andersonii]
MNFPTSFSSLLLFLLFFSLHSIPSPGLSQPVGARCPPISPPPQPRSFPRVRPRPPLYPPGLKLMPRRPVNNTGPLANRARILFIAQELKRNITYDPFNYTATWFGNNYCRFKGFYCDTVPDLNITGLASIDFNGARFGGVFLNFYRFIRNLPDIAIFHANSNNFSGVISRNINQLRYLYELDLSNNKFLGGFPANVLGATNLTFVDLRFNGYNGSVPTQLFNFDTDILFINNNGFSQRIPSNFGNTPAIYLTLAGNRFTGSIPPSIGRAWKTLKEVLLLNNRLTGCLPYEIGYLTKTTVFDVGSNLLTGPIPQSFGCLASLQFLNLAHNQFYGAIPESLCKIRSAYNYTLSYNFFTQVGTECRSLIRDGRLHVGRNCVMGLPNQKPASECSLFFSRPRTCWRESSFSFVPCALSNTSSFDGRLLEEIAAPQQPQTYAALEKPHP